MSNHEYAQATDDQLTDWAYAAAERECAAAEADQWEREMAQLRWAENGGYAAGLCRPA